MGMPRLGILLGDRHFDLFSYTSLLGIELPFDPFDLQSLIASGETGLRQLNDAAQSKTIDCAVLRPESIELLAPIRPRNALYAVGWNYVDHFFEGKDSGRPNTPTAYPEHPVLFVRLQIRFADPMRPFLHMPPLPRSWIGRLNSR